MFSISRFQQLMKALPRSDFEAMVREHGANKHDKKFSAWDQLVAMVFGQLSGASSLRQIEAGFNAQLGQHYHLCTRQVHRSTLADANNKRCVQVFAQAVRHLMGQADRRVRSQMGQLLYVLDSTPIVLKGQGFDEWTLGTRTRHIQGLKLHVLYEAHSQMPMMQGMSSANVNDIEWALGLPIEPGARYVFDKGYCDYNWWARIEARGALFVTRFKRNAALVLERERALEERGRSSRIGWCALRSKTAGVGARTSTTSRCDE